MTRTAQPRATATRTSPSGRRRRRRRRSGSGGRGRHAEQRRPAEHGDPRARRAGPRTARRRATSRRSAGPPGWRPSGSGGARAASPAGAARRSSPSRSSWPGARPWTGSWWSASTTTAPRSRCWKTACSSSTTWTRASHQSYVGNVYLGKVQNVLPSMEAAFVDIGKGRNAVLYAGEVNFDASGLEGESKRIESALKSGQSILVQVTKDPIGHKGARLTSQVSLPGRYLVYVPGSGDDRDQPQAAGHRADPAQADPQEGHAGERRRDRAHRRRGRLGGGAVARRVPAVRAVGGDRGQDQDGQRARAAVQRARPDHPGGQGHLQRGLQRRWSSPATATGTSWTSTSATWRRTCPSG